ncbi:MAG: transposase [Spirochaetia bacterium]
MTPDIREPEFCPRKACKYYERENVENEDWYCRYGTHYSKSRGRIQRFKCRNCGKTFSTQTFSIHYWTHITIDFESFAGKLYSCSGLLQLSRTEGYTYRVVQNRIRRLARNSLAALNSFYRTHTLQEDLVMDGFESFTRSQYFPNNITIIVGKKSQFIFAAIQTLIKRKGRMTEQQKIFRDFIYEHWEPPRSIQDDVRVILADCLPMMQKCMANQTLKLISDKHSSYPPAINKIKELKDAKHKGTFRHVRIKARKKRTKEYNPLFAVDYVDRQIRNNMAEHVRETIRQGREVNCQMERAAIFAAMHNFNTPHRIRHKAHPENEITHRNIARVNPPKLDWYLKRIFTHRHLMGHLSEPVQWIKQVWQFQYENPPGFNFVKMVVSNKVMALQPGNLAGHFLA